MSYSSKTNIYQIPFMSNGEVASGAENQHAANIADQQMVGFVRSLGFYSGADINMVLSEGTYSIAAAGGYYAATLASLEAVLGNVYLKTTTTKTWSGIPISGVTYLYAALMETDYSNSSRAHGEWNPYSSSVLEPSSSRLLLAKNISGIVYSSPSTLAGKSVYSGILPIKLLQDGTITQDKVAAGVVTVSSLYNIQKNDRLVRCSGIFAVKLPAAQGTGRKYTVKTVGSGQVTVSGIGGDLIDGTASYVLSTQYSKLTVIDGLQGCWDIV